jgi:glycosyltransferase involved in cell wall biosynthesis
MAIGGVQRGLLATLARADRERFDFHVLCTKKEGRWANDVRALGIPLTLQKTLPPWDPFQIARLAGVLRRLRPDLVHIHMAPMVIPVAGACRLAGIRRVLIQWHSDYARFWNVQQNALLRAWERRLTRRADAVIAVSRSAADANAPRMGLLPEAVGVVPNGIDLDRWRNATPVDPRPAWKLPPETPLVVHVARYLETKLIEDFIDAAGRIAERWPQLPTAGKPVPAFVVIGGGADGFRRRYERRIEQVRGRVPGARVWLEGNRDDLPSLLPCAQVGVLATENEGCPNAILEYIGVGLPMVASDIPPVADLVRDGETALLVPPREVAPLANAIERLLLDEALADRLRENCRREAPKHEWGAAARAYEAVYERILAGKAG